MENRATEATVKLSPMHTFPKINICILFQTPHTSILPEGKFLLRDTESFTAWVWQYPIQYQ